MGMVAGLLGYVIVLQLTQACWVSVRFDASSFGVAKVYYADDRGFREEQVKAHVFPAGDDQELRFRLPLLGEKHLRYDPTDHPGIITVHRIHWEEPWPGKSGHLNPKAAQVRGVVSAEPVPDGGLRIIPRQARLPDPQLMWREPVGGAAWVWWAYRGSMVLLAFSVGAWAAVFWNRRVFCRRSGPRSQSVLAR